MLSSLTSLVCVEILFMVDLQTDNQCIFSKYSRQMQEIVCHLHSEDGCKGFKVGLEDGCVVH